MSKDEFLSDLLDVLISYANVAWFEDRGMSRSYKVAIDYFEDVYEAFIGKYAPLDTDR